MSNLYEIQCIHPSYTASISTIKLRKCNLKDIVLVWQPKLPAYYLQSVPSSTTIVIKHSFGSRYARLYMIILPVNESFGMVGLLGIFQMNFPLSPPSELLSISCENSSGLETTGGWGSGQTPHLARLNHRIPVYFIALLKEVRRAFLSLGFGRAQ